MCVCVCVCVEGMCESPVIATLRVKLTAANAMNKLLNVVGIGDGGEESIREETDSLF